jgi:hypothetical protein
MSFDFNYDSPGGMEIKDGLYDGVIDAAAVKKSQSGNNYLALSIKLANGLQVRENLNLEHATPDVKKIAVDKVQSIIAFGVDKPDAKFSNIDAVAAYLKGIPVRVFYKGKGMNDHGYPVYSLTFKPLEADKKIAKASQPAASIY